jgi:hypothetical protein
MYRFVLIFTVLYVASRSLAISNGVFTGYQLISDQFIPIAGVSPLGVQFMGTINQCAANCKIRNAGCCGFLFQTSECGSIIRTTVGKCQLMQLIGRNVVFYTVQAPPTIICQVFFADSSYLMTSVTGTCLLQLSLT